MSWDWKKAIGVGGDSGLAAMAGSGAKRSPADNEAHPHPPGRLRAPSIAWRTAGSAYALPSGGVELVTEADHECPFCRGRGQLAGGSICPVCNGRKTVSVQPPSVICPDCQGRGKKPSQSLYCPTCKGVGVVPRTGEL